MSEQPTLFSENEQEQVEYRDIAGFPGYRVGDDGSVWSCRSRNGVGQLKSVWKKLLVFTSHRGYQSVSLCFGKQKSTQMVHRLVLVAFIGKCPDDKEGCHNNGNPSDNCLSNLRWDTHVNNQADCKRHGTYLSGEKVHGAKLTEMDVLAIKKTYAAGEISQDELAARYSVGRTAITAIVNGRTWVAFPGISKPARVTKKGLRGERNPQAKLTVEQVIAIRQMANSGNHTQREIGAMFGVSKTTVRNIVTGRVWSCA